MSNHRSAWTWERLRRIAQMDEFSRDLMLYFGGGCFVLLILVSLGLWVIAALIKWVIA